MQIPLFLCFFSHQSGLFILNSFSSSPSYSFSQLSSFHDDINGLVSTPFSNYLKLYENALRARGGDFIIIDARPLATKEDIKNKLQPHKNIIFEAADHFHIDSYLLGAILIDEIARTAPLENIFNNVTVNFLGRNTSLGIAQMKTDTAYDLVKSNLYNPNPNDEFLKHKLNPAVRSRLYEYLIQPKHSIFFAAAGIRSLINNWKRFINLENRPEILATLYSRKYKDPHVKPESNERGLQIANEFYSLAEQWLK